MADYHGPDYYGQWTNGKWNNYNYGTGPQASAAPPPANPAWQAPPPPIAVGQRQAPTADYYNGNNNRNHYNLQFAPPDANLQDPRGPGMRGGIPQAAPSAPAAPAQPAPAPGYNPGTTGVWEGYYGGPPPPPPPPPGSVARTGRGHF